MASDLRKDLHNLPFAHPTELIRQKANGTITTETLCNLRHWFHQGFCPWSGDRIGEVQHDLGNAGSRNQRPTAVGSSLRFVHERFSKSSKAAAIVRSNGPRSVITSAVAWRKQLAVGNYRQVIAQLDPAQVQMATASLCHAIAARRPSRQTQCQGKQARTCTQADLAAQAGAEQVLPLDVRLAQPGAVSAATDFLIVWAHGSCKSS